MKRCRRVVGVHSACFEKLCGATRVVGVVVGDHEMIHAPDPPGAEKGVEMAAEHVAAEGAGVIEEDSALGGLEDGSESVADGEDREAGDEWEASKRQPAECKTRKSEDEENAGSSAEAWAACGEKQKAVVDDDCDG